MNIVIIAAACAASLTIIVMVVQRQAQTARQDRPRRLERLAALKVSPQVAHYVANGERLKAVKAYRDGTGLGLKEATSYIDEMMKQAN
jgi:ribosomal protein L7/L12